MAPCLFSNMFMTICNAEIVQHVRFTSHEVEQEDRWHVDQLAID